MQNPTYLYDSNVLLPQPSDWETYNEINLALVECGLVPDDTYLAYVEGREAVDVNRAVNGEYVEIIPFAEPDDGKRYLAALTKILSLAKPGSTATLVDVDGKTRTIITAMPYNTVETVTEAHQGD